MQHRPRTFLRVSALSLGTGSILFAVLAAGLVPQASVAASGEDHAQVSIAVKGLRNKKGYVHVCMTDKANRFPDKCTGFRKTVAARSNLVLTFSDVPAGRYAIALVHDENGNGKMDMTMGIMPREGFGFSRDPALIKGPPRFSSAAFDVGHNNVRQTINIRYLL